MLQTELTRRLGIEHPIIQAGMGMWTRVDLVAAVSNAGALGTVGSIGHLPDVFAAEIRACQAATSRPFAANLVCWDWAPFAASMVDIAVEARVPVITLSFGDPLPALAKAKAAGLRTLVQVQDLAGARAAIDARPDAVIVQGNEAGGHTGRRGTLSFAAQVLDMAGDVPVVVAGGIANGRGLAAALAMGAAGVVMGTRFKATPEFAIGRHIKEAIVASDGSNTVYDEVVDLAYGGTWPNGVTGRVLRNRFTDEWLDRDEELRAAVAAEPGFAFSQRLDSDPATQLNWAGESSGLVEAILPAAEVVRRTVELAEELLGRVGPHPTLSR
jgi:nitronate monooxygenase